MPDHAQPPFEDFFRQVSGRAVDTAERVLCKRMAGEDAAVEALIRAHRHWGKLASAPYREAWVLRVTVNLALDELRRDRRRLRLTPTIATASFENDLVDHLAVTTALSRLPRRQRVVVGLRFFADLIDDSIASGMGVSPGTVKTHLRRGVHGVGHLSHLVTEEVL